MLTIAGNPYVHPEARDGWIEAHHDTVKRARSQPGCLDLYLSADPVEEGRVNMFEMWESERTSRGMASGRGPAPETRNPSRECAEASDQLVRPAVLSVSQVASKR